MKPDEPQSLAFRFFVAYWRLGRRLKDHLDPLLIERYGLELKDYLVLGSIYRGYDYPTELAELLDMPKDMVSRIIHKLSREGLLLRSIDDGDSRKTKLSISDKGIELRHKIRQDIQASLEPGLEHLGHPQSEALISALEHLSEHIASS
ncbi:MAG: MarR family winged helix-turn-helix transcriptional regulator [Deinococcales bacterium]